MNLTIQLFANFREYFQKPYLTVEISTGATVATLRQELCKRYPEWIPSLERTMVAVNQKYAMEADILHEEDEIALIPPVGGGSQNTMGMEGELSSCRITTEALDINAAYQFLENAYHGGTVLFCGTVREWTKGRQTRHLTYDAYIEMGIQQMKQIEIEVQAEFPHVRTLQWHRIGLLQPTDIAVICAASSPHRNDAFLAARQLIERLKKEVAIWKKEQYADGEAQWQPNEQG